MAKTKFSLMLTILLLVILVIGGYYLFYDSSLSPSSSGCDTFDLLKDKKAPVPVELAKSVASDYVHKYYSGFTWVYVGSIPAYSAYFGTPSGYAFIFRKDSQPLSTLGEYENYAKGKPEGNQEQSAVKYLFNDVATIITSAMKEDELILRHFRGLPEFFVKRQENKEYVEAEYPGRTIGRLMMHTPMSFGYEILDKFSKKPTGDIIFGTRVDSSSRLLNNYKNNIEQRDAGRSPADCQMIKDAIIEAKKANIIEWDSPR